MCSWHLKFNMFKIKLICTPPTNLLPLQYAVQFSSVVQSYPTLRPHGPQHTRPPCPSPAPGVHSNSRLSSQWCHPAISSSVVPFSSCLQSSPSITVFSVSKWQFCSSRRWYSSFLFLSVLSLCCCPRAFSSWGEWELLPSLRWLLLLWSMGSRYASFGSPRTQPQ